jgi:hypothetical protein
MALIDDRDYSRSRAILIGTSEYSEGLKQLPEAERSLSEMYRMLTGANCGWPADRVSVFRNEQSAEETMREIWPLLRDASDVLLFYFVGHGISVNEDQELCLTVSRTVQGLAASTSLLLSKLYELTSHPRHPTTTRIFLLDCCFSGVGTVLGEEDPVALINTLPSADGVFTLTASKARQWAYTEGANGMTYFTKCLTEIVAEGKPGGPAMLSLLDIYDMLELRFQAVSKLTATPQTPAKKIIDNAHRYGFAHNAAWRNPPAPMTGTEPLPPRITDVPDRDRRRSGGNGRRPGPARRLRTRLFGTGPLTKALAGLGAAALTVGICAAAVFLGVHLLGRHAGTGTPTPGSSQTGPLGQMLGQGTLTLLGNGTGYDLDAVNSGWAPLAQASWAAQNIMYAPAGGANDKPIIDIAGSPATDVVMPGRGPWTYQDCASAAYDVNTSTTGPNAVTGASLYVGEGICVETQNTPHKHDGNHIVLLVVTALDLREATVQVEVWY